MKYKIACLVVLCGFLNHMTVIGSDIILYHTVAIDGSLTYLVSQAMAYLLYPFLGWLADVYFTRYKFIIFSVIAMIVATVLMIVAAVLLIVFSEVRALFALVGVSMIVGLIGMGSFESTVIQFGMDQMLEASSDQLSTFIQWYNWSCNIGQVISVYISAGVLEYFSQCTMVLNTHNPEKIRSTIHPYYFLIYGLAVASPYVGMARFQDGGSNQCISVFTAISSPENK